MSMIRCDKCERHIDTDWDVECFVAEEEPRVIFGHDVLCEHCRNDALDEILRDEAAASAHQDAAERAGALS